jgi:hypothetical protein
MRKAAVTIVGFVLSFIACRVLKKKLTNEIPLGNGGSLDGPSGAAMEVCEKFNLLNEKELGFVQTPRRLW